MINQRSHSPIHISVHTQELFDTLDEDKSGSIDAMEFMHALEMLGLEVAWSEMEVGSNLESIYLVRTCRRLISPHWYSAFISVFAPLGCTLLDHCIPIGLHHRPSSGSNSSRGHGWIWIA